MATNDFDRTHFDPYRALGVARGATGAQIKRAHRTLAKRYHPDAATGDTARFLAVHEAYRVLSDPLRRREWDDKHAPGPVRADATPPAHAPRKSSARARRAATDNAAPRSKRAYRWSASEVPWWEEGAARNRRARRTAGASSEPPAQENQPSREGQAAEGRQAAAPDFEVYNRSSGAAWSMAARAYFRRGDEDLPRRGQFHYQGTQVVTAGRARAAQAQAQRAGQRATEPAAEPAEKTTNPPAAKTATPPAAKTAAGVLGRLRRRLSGDH